MKKNHWVYLRISKMNIIIKYNVHLDKESQKTYN